MKTFRHGDVWLKGFEAVGIRGGDELHRIQGAAGLHL